jgi:hypothetical protein
VLPCYCIENILVDPVAIGELIFEEDLRLEKEAVLRLFDYRGWHRSSAAALAILFVHYAVAFKLAPQIQTVGFRANGLVKAPTGEIDRRKLGRRICELRRAVEDLVGAVRYREEYQSILEKVRLKKPDILFHVSGKDYLLPLLFMRLKTVVKTSTPYAQLKVRLALKCELRYLEGVDSYIAG